MYKVGLCSRLLNEVNERKASNEKDHSRPQYDVPKSLDQKSCSWQHRQCTEDMVSSIPNDSDLLTPVPH